MSEDYKDDPNWILAQNVYAIMLQAIRQDKAVDFLFGIIEQVQAKSPSIKIDMEDVVTSVADLYKIKRLRLA